MPAYDAVDTAHWMLEGLKVAIESPTVEGPDGRRKKKTKAQMLEEQVRVTTLCELLWNIEGRPDDFTRFAEQRLAA